MLFSFVPCVTVQLCLGSVGLGGSTCSVPAQLHHSVLFCIVAVPSCTEHLCCQDLTLAHFGECQELVSSNEALPPHLQDS